jgi:Domain of unknown function (DUF1824)
MTPQDAEAALKNLEDLGTAVTAEQGETIRQALQTLATASDYPIFGVCVDSQSIGLTTLKEYAHSFGYDLTEALAQQCLAIGGAVYLKFNPRTQRCFADAYTGAYRGVLISFQSDFEDGYSGTHGHFPLDLFCEG